MHDDGKAGKKAKNIVVIAASTGGIEALQTVMNGLPGNLEAAIGIAQHVSPVLPSQLVKILSRHTPMPVKHAVDGDVLCHGCIFIAPPNQHLFIEPGGIAKLSNSPPIHFSRPSAEPLFSSAAAVFGKKVVGVVLTGSDSDGSIGVQLIKNMGGCVIVQDEATSENFGMPRASILTGRVDRILPLTEIAPTIVKLVEKLNATSEEECSSC